MKKKAWMGRTLSALSLVRRIMKKVLFPILCAVLALLSALSIYMIVNHYVEEKNASDSYSEMQEFVVPDTKQEPTETEAHETTPDETSGSTTGEEENTGMINVNFDDLLAKYPDVVGWLYCEGTPINYPIMQSDDNDYYLRRLPDGTYNTAGSLFADYRCGEIGESNNYIVYGHNMKNGTMFSSLTKYKSQSYYDEHPVIYLLTSEGKYTIELIGGFVSKPTGDVYNTTLSYETVRELLQHSTFRSNIEVSEDDRYITLSTCSYEYENARYVVIGVVK